MNSFRNIVIKVGPKEVKSNRDYLWYSLKWLIVYSAALSGVYFLSMIGFFFIKNVEVNRFVLSFVFIESVKALRFFWIVFLSYGFFIYRQRRSMIFPYLIIDPNKKELCLYEENNQNLKYIISEAKILKNSIVLNGIQNYYIDSMVVRDLDKKTSTDDLILLKQLFQNEVQGNDVNNNFEKDGFRSDFLAKYKFLFIFIALVEVKLLYGFFSPETAQLIYSFDGKFPYLDFSFLQNVRHQAALQWFICSNLMYVLMGIPLYFIERKNHLKALDNQQKATMHELK